jgi:hypothetical protein
MGCPPLTRRTRLGPRERPEIWRDAAPWTTSARVGTSPALGAAQHRASGASAWPRRQSCWGTSARGRSPPADLRQLQPGPCRGSVLRTATSLSGHTGLPPASVQWGHPTQVSVIMPRCESHTAQSQPSAAGHLLVPNRAGPMKISKIKDRYNPYRLAYTGRSLLPHEAENQSQLFLPEKRHEHPKTRRNQHGLQRLVPNVILQILSHVFNLLASLLVIC